MNPFVGQVFRLVVPVAQVFRPAVLVAQVFRPAIAIAAVSLTLPFLVFAQAPDLRNLDPTARAGQREGGAPARTPKEAARIDITGYWVSIVTEDWRFRMVTAPKGDYPNVPLNAEGRKVAGAWDPARDEASGDRCKAYGAPNIMRVPGRFHITWTNESTLKIETDAGMQTRTLRFDAPPAPTGSPQRQGYSIAQWNGRRALKVVTTHLLPGYLQTNGVPFSDKTVMTEYFDVLNEPNGDTWLVVTAVVEDPPYLVRSFIRSTHFRKQPDASGWDPTPCAVK